MKPIDILINTMKRKIKPTHKSIKSLYIFLKSPTFREGFLRFDVYVIGNKDSLLDNMCAFLDYLQGKDAESKLTKAIETSVDKAIERSDWRVEYMTLNAKIMEEREDERIKNILTTISILKGLGIQDSKITEQISERFGITLDETYKYLDKYYEEENKTNS